MFGRNYFGGPTFGGARPTARMAGRPKLGQQQGLACCNMPNGEGHCFDNGSGECIDLWVSASGAPPGSPACVQNPQGQYVHPSCLGLEVPPGPTTRPELPPGCSYVAAEGNAMQEVICECYNCTTKKSDGWRGMLGVFIASGGKNPCLRDPQWFPKPAQCPPGGGGTFTPPVDAPTTSSESSIPPTNTTFEDVGEESAPPPVSEGDTYMPPPVSEGDTYTQPPTTVLRPTYYVPPTGGSPNYYAPPAAGPYPTSPRPLTIQPSPFGGGNVVPRQVPLAPSPAGMPLQKQTFSSCPASTPPVRVRKLRSQTSQARPDNFPPPLWTNF